MIAVIDFGAGNLRSVVKAIAYLGYQAQITTAPQDVLRAQAIILPGVGSAPQALNQLYSLNLILPINQVINQGKPFLGICLGMQVLFDFSEEGGGFPCLHILSGEVKRLPAGLKTPHIGWDSVSQKISHPIFKHIPNPAYFYFAHSYYAEPKDKSIIAAQTFYGLDFPSVIIKENMIATQFHPEKSGEWGLKLIHNFLTLALDKKD